MKFFRACFIVLILISFVSCGGGDKTTDSGGNGNGGQNMPPASPSVPQPPNGVTNQSLTTTLSWTCSDPENDPLTYDVWFGTSPTPPVVASSIATASYRPSAMQYNNTYYWKVEAKTITVTNPKARPGVWRQRRGKVAYTKLDMLDPWQTLRMWR